MPVKNDIWVFLFVIVTKEPDINEMQQELDQSFVSLIYQLWYTFIIPYWAYPGYLTLNSYRLIGPVI